MNFLFRVDAGGDIGLGHYYRSLSLANYLSKRGHNICFIHLPSIFWQQEANSNFAYQALVLNEGNPDQDSLGIILNQNIDVFYVDGIIEMSEQVLEHIRHHCKVVFYQNLSSTRHLCDVFIIPSVHQSSELWKNFKHSVLCYKGLKYMTFHPVIKSLDRKAHASKTVQRIGIIAGGSDPRDTIKRIYDLTDFEYFAGIDFVFFYGKQYLHLKSLPKVKLANVEFKLFNHKDILACDMIISAFGVSTYEMMYLGMPTIAYGHQKSNVDAAEYISAKMEMSISIGLIDQITKEVLNYAIDNMVGSFKTREKLIKNARVNLDLKGEERIAKLLEQLKKDE